VITRLVLAVVVAVIVGLLLAYLLGPILVSLAIPIAVVVGEFFVKWGFALGVLAGIWYFFSGSTWPMRKL
jgi:uncharacterized membrane protein YvlD (DUF360 family)